MRRRRGGLPEISDRFGHVNAPVNAVGAPTQGGFDDFNDAGWLEALDLGVLSAVRTVRHALPLLRRAPWARIVNITAMSVKDQSPGLIAYTASKAALARVTKNLARSLGPDQSLSTPWVRGRSSRRGSSAQSPRPALDGSDPRSPTRSSSSSTAITPISAASARRRSSPR